MRTLRSAAVDCWLRRVQRTGGGIAAETRPPPGRRKLTAAGRNSSGSVSGWPAKLAKEAALTLALSQRERE
jgi:hypothetical protein